MVTVADQFAAILAAVGVKRIYGIVGDSLNGLTDAIRRQGEIDWLHVRHEEVAAFAAGAEAHLTGELAVCAGSCGPGNLHLINVLFDCHRSRVPVLAIAAHIQSAEIGGSYFQATHPEQLFAECAHYVELVSNADQMPRIFEKAIRIAIARRGVSVVVIPGDIALLATDAKAASWLAPNPPVVRPSDAEVDALAKLLNDGERITMMCGAGCAGAHAGIVELAGKLNAPIVHSLRGKEHVEYDNPFDVGMTGLIGFASGYAAMKSCDTLLLLGTDFPYRQFYPEGAKVAQVDIRSESLGNRCHLALGVVGDVATTVAALLPKLKKKGDRKYLDAALAHYKKAREDLDKLAEGKPGGKIIHPQYLSRLVSEIGAQATYPARQVISMSGDGGFSMMMGDFISLTQLGLPVKVIVLNNGTLGFVEMEMKASGFLDTGTELKNPNFAAMAEAMGIKGIRVEKPQELKGAIEAALAHKGPVLVDVVSARQELAMPPRTTLDQAYHFGMFMMKAVLDGRATQLIDLARVNLSR